MPWENGTSSILLHCSLKKKKKSQVYFFGELYTGSRTDLIGRNWVTGEASPNWSWYFYIFLRAVGGEIGGHTNQRCQLIAHISLFPIWFCTVLWKYFFLRLRGKVGCEVIHSAIRVPSCCLSDWNALPYLPQCCNIKIPWFWIVVIYTQATH